MPATFRIIQDAVEGEYGISRQDISLYSFGGTITLEAQDQTGGLTGYVWEVLSEPEGSAATIITPDPAEPWEVEVDLTVTGSYLFRLMFMPGEAEEDIQVLLAGIPLANSGLCIPALNETLFDNSYSAGSSGDTYVGYERKLNAMLKWMDANGGGAGITLSGYTQKSTVSTKLTLNYPGALDTENETVYFGDMMLVAKEEDGAGSPGGLKSWSIKFTARNDADGNVEVLTPIDITVNNSTSISNEPSWALDAITIDGDAVGDPIEIYVIGGAGVNWEASINMTTVTGPTGGGPNA